MGRVNLDQLEMMKDFSSSAEEEGETQEQQQEDQDEGEEGMMAVDMVTDGRVSFEEQGEGEDGEDMEAAESAEAEQREANDGVMAEHEEEGEREEGEVAVKEVPEKPVAQGRWSSVCHLLFFRFNSHLFCLPVCFVSHNICSLLL